jgi:serine/threonine protein phosphatase PrpC
MASFITEPIKEKEVFEKQTINACVKGFVKDQDFAVSGKTHSEDLGTYSWGCLLDGHGTDTFINRMRVLNWENIMSTIEPWETLEKIIIDTTVPHDKFSSGSTLLMMRAFSNRIETWSIGDSQIIIYKNEVEVYKSTPHNLNNPKEVERLNKLPTGSWWEETMRFPVFQIRSSTSLQAREAVYIFFNQETQLAMTQSIGHSNITGYAPEKNIVYFTPEDKMTCILGSDGLFDMTLMDGSIHPPLTETEANDLLVDKMDMLTMTAEELLAKVEARWKQQWKYMWDLTDFTKSYHATIEDRHIDDISVIVWKQNRIQK